MVAVKKHCSWHLVVLIVILISGCDIKYLRGILFKPNNTDFSIGTKENPFDWSTTAKQIATAPNLSLGDSRIYVRTQSNKIRIAEKNEIEWVINQYTNHTPYIPDPPKIMYYGANIGQFPPFIRDWIVNEQFTKVNMEENYMIDPKLKAWWSNDGNTVLFEASYIVASGYVGAGTRETWGTGAYYSGGDLQPYGQFAKYQTLKFKYDFKRETEYLTANDPAYAEVINFAKKLCSEIEYDWTNFSGYKGARPIKTPGKIYAVCSGYSDEVMDKILALKCIKSVEEWTGPDHAWNVLNLVDGRTLYLDLTWFDNEHINEDTGKIYQTDDYDWENITFKEDLFRYSNVGYLSNTFTHDQGKFERIVRRIY